MIISHRHKFIFFKTRKTASTSLEIALTNICGEEDVITPFGKYSEEVRARLCTRSPQNYDVPLPNYGPIDYLKVLIQGKKRAFYNHMTAEKSTQIHRQEAMG